MIALVGYTGFVGSNIYAKGKVDRAFNSKNITDAYGLKPDLLIYAGLRAEKYLANSMPDKDMESICQAAENIFKIAPKRLVLISTIDVFQNPQGVDEDAEVVCEGLNAYGQNRYRLECLVREKHPDALIIRLPALYGINIKKNFIYDIMNVIPYALTGHKFHELAGQNPDIADFYVEQGNGFYQCRTLDAGEKETLKGICRRLGFTALNFTDSRNTYQFYPLARLWGDIQTALDHHLKLWHPATEPVSAGELYEYLTGMRFVNEIPGRPVRYDFRTKHGKLFGASGRYLMDKGQVMDDVRRFIEAEGKEIGG